MMQANNAILKLISNETLDSIHNIGVVTPSIYTSIFTENALKHEINIDDENKLTDTLLDSKIQLCQSVQEKKHKQCISTQ
ncbi:MAG: hypothetical protein Q9M43_08260 [Sulfurimonas sp.]|nr:hypothetical protein [Sulfurimonas sp.]